MPRILIVDDEQQMRDLISLYLKHGNYDVDQASSGLEAIDKVQMNDFDLLIVDVMMPDLDGFDVCAFVAEAGYNTKIMMLTARAEIEDRVKGLNLGADDYLTKPFAPEEFIARVNALTRRDRNVASPHSLKVNDELMIYPSAREVWVKQQRVELTSKEFDLLTLFVRNTTQIYTRELLMNLLGNNEEHYERRTIDTHVKNIRLKLSQALLSFDPIKTVRGVGYGFRQPGAKS